MDDFQLNLLITADNKAQGAFDAAKKQADDLAKQQADIAAKIAAAQTIQANGQIKVNTSAAIFLGLKKQETQLTAQHTEALKQQEKATNDLEKANAKLASAQHQMAVTQQRSMDAAGASLMNYIKGFAGVAGVVQIIRTAVMANAEFERGMTRIRNESNSVSSDLNDLQTNFHALAQSTGKDTAELMGSFRAFRDAIGGQGSEGLNKAYEVFEKIQEAADVTGVSFETLGKAAVDAMKVMHVPMTEIEGVLDTWVNTIPASMMQQWNQASTGIIGSLKDIGATGTDAAKQAGAAFGNVASALGDASKAGNLLQSTLDKSTDTGTAFGRQMVNYVQNMGAAALESGEFLDRSYEKLKANGVYQEHLDSRDMARKVFARGWSAEQLRNLEEAVLAERRIQDEHKRTHENINTIRQRHSRQQADAKGEVDGLIHSAQELYTEIGKAFGVTPVQAFTEILRTTTQEVKAIAEFLGKIQRFIGGGTGSTPPLVDESGDRTIDPKTGKPEMPQGYGTRRTGRYVGQGQLAGPQGGAPPKMALGGSFEVEGKGGIDQQPVGFMGTPGEKVQVTTPMQESLQQQQDKADIAMREHFARFHGSAFTKTQSAAWWPQGGARPLGGGGAGSAAGGIPGGSTGGAGPTTASPGSAGADGKVSPEAATSTAPAGTTPATLPGSVASLGYEPGKFTPVQDLTTAAGTSGGGGGGGGLAADRAKFAAEMAANPALREKVLAIANNEQGGNAQGMQATIESMMNRASYQGTTLAKQARWVSERGYYADGKKASGMNRPITEAALAGALGGSNVSNYGTDNASTKWGADRIKRDLYRQTNFINGEYFSSPGQNPAGPGIGNFNKYQTWLANMKKGDAAAPAAGKESAVKTAKLTPNTNAALPAGALDPNLTKLPAAGGGGGDLAIDEAMKMEGLHEEKDREKLKEYMKTGGRSLSGEDNAWCARFVNAINVKSGLPGNDSWAAKSFLQWGKGVGASDALLKGDVFVKDRGGDKGHTGVFTGKTMKDPKTGETLYQMVQGNVGNKVALTWERRSGLVGVRRGTPVDPTATAAGATTVKTATVKPNATAVDTAFLSPTVGPSNKPAAAPTNTKVATDAPAVGQKTEDHGGPKAAGKNLGGGTGGKPYVAPEGEGKAAGKNLGTPSVAVSKATKVAAAGVAGGEARQWGGDVRAGRQYTVGESGPEQFVPSSPGRIVPGGVDASGMMGEYNKFAEMMRAPIIPNLQMPRAGPIRQRMSRHVEAQRERDVGRMTRHSSHSDIGFA